MAKKYSMLKKTFFFLIVVANLMSCASKKEVYYFQDIDQAKLKNNFNLINIQPGDILDIQIKALNPESVIVFQRQNSINTQQLQGQNRVIEGYLVGKDGKINLPIVGSINTSGKTPEDLALKIQEELNAFVKNTSVNIRILNFRISVLGEVNRPGTFTVLEERVSLPQALGLAGDLTINGDRKSILVIRNENGKIINRRIDLTKSEIISSPFYFLKQNDVIYIQPNTARVKSSGLVGNTSTLVSVLSLAVSLFIVITR